jgi:non-specific serine/threonine protein kinase
MPVEDEHASQRMPSTPDAFVGRDSEIAEIASLLATARVFTLTGPGGVGKTRLATQLAARHGDVYPDGVRWVDLASLDDATLLPHRVAARCGVAIPGGTAVTGALVAALRHRQLLLVLDNCEHLAAACASLVETLLAACPGVHVLATSRELLGIPGEVVWLLAPLAVPPEDATSPEALVRYDAVRLLVARTAATLPGFALASDNAGSVARICRRLEGLPLALELAAARLRTLSPADLATRLDDTMRVLTQGRRTAPERHRTLRAAVDWSHRLLADTDRAVFARLSVFAGSFSLRAAEHVCAPPGVPAPAVLDAIGRLVDASLLTVHDRAEETRYHLLEPLRQYAAEQLAATGDAEEARRRHRDWYAALARDAAGRLSGPAQGLWLDRLESEHDNLAAALGWSLERGDATGAGNLAASIWTFWLMRGYVQEGRRWLAAILTALPEPTALRAHLLWIAGILDRPDAAEGRRHLAESLRIWRAIGDADGQARALSTLGFLAQSIGDHGRAVARLEESLALLEADRAARGRALTGVALSTLALGDTARAAELAREARQVWRGVGDAAGEAAAIANLGIACRVAGDDERAERLWEESLAARRGVGDRGGVAHVLALLGDLAARRGDRALAMERLLASLEACRPVGDEHTVAAVCEGMAAVVLAGDPALAARLAGAASAIRATSGEPALPWDRVSHERTLRALRARLDPSVLDAAWRFGEQATDAISIAALLRSAAEPSDAGDAGPRARIARRETLTAREVEVLRLLTFGMTYAQIGEALAISPRTVDAHARSIFGKLDVHSRSAATRIAVQERLV